MEKIPQERCSDGSWPREVCGGKKDKPRRGGGAGDTEHRGIPVRLSLPVNPSAERDGAWDGAGCPQGDEARGRDLL